MWLTKDIHHLKLNFFPSIVYCLRASQICFINLVNYLMKISITLHCFYIISYIIILYYIIRFVSHEHLKYSVILIVLFKKLRSGLRPLNLRVWGGCAGTYKFYSEPSSVKSEPAMWSSISVSYNFRVCFTGLMLWWPLIGPLYPRSQERRRRGLSVTFLSCVRVRQVN